MNKKKIITWILFFLIFFAVTQLFNKKNAPAVLPTDGNEIIVSTLSNEYTSGSEVILQIENNTTKELILPSSCPKNPFRVLAWNGSDFAEVSKEATLNCDEIGREIKLLPNAKTKISYTYWNHALFGQPNRYKIAIELPGTKENDKKTITSPEFTVVAPGFWKKLFRNFFYQPLYNVLVMMIAIAPMKDLGFAIILLTLLIRLILLVPSQRAIISQRRMQELQPRLAHIKKQYEGNQEKIAQETMKLWKDNKVNPFGSCLPTLIQFPVLIALYYVIRNGLNPDNAYMIYEPLKNISLAGIHTNFLGILELTHINKFVLPLIVGALQFLQLKLAMAVKKPQKDANKGSEMDTANKTMTYIMPVMIALFTASVPAGVGLYWGVSTLFALGQQIVANRKSLAHADAVVK